MSLSRVSRTRRYCCVRGCKSRRRTEGGVSFFSLPNDLERRNMWLEVMDRSDLIDRSQLRNKSHEICSIHFVDSMVAVTKKLRPGAIPTRFVPNPPDIDVPDYPPIVADKGVQTDILLKTPNNSVFNSDFSVSSINIYDNSIFTFPKLEGLAVKEDIDSNSDPNSNEDLTLKLPEDNDEVTSMFHKLKEWHSNIKDMKMGNRIQPDLKFFLLSYYFSSPHSYCNLASLLGLPQKKTLAKLKLRIPHEFDERSIHFLASKFESLPREARYCAICIDQIPLTRRLYYDIRNDEILGLHNINGEVTNKVASRAFVIMIQGVTVNWKQPIAYAMLADSNLYKDLDKWINTVLSKLFDLGVKVMAVVSNQEKIFNKYAKQIKHVTSDKPYFMFGASKIYYIFEVSSLLVGLRNDLLEGDLSYDGNNVSWKYIMMLYNYQKEQNLHCLPNITKAHIEPENAHKRKAQYAIDIFSPEVCTSLKIFIHTQLLPDAARPTAIFFEVIHTFYKILHDPRSCSLGKFQEDSLKFARNIIAKMNTSYPKKSDRLESKSLRNLEITIVSIIMLRRCLQQESSTLSLLMNRLNLNPMRQLFQKIIVESGNRIKPSPVKFTRAFSKMYLVNMMHKSPMNKDSMNLNDVLSKEKHELAQWKVDPSTAVSVGGDVDYRFDVPAKYGMAYVAAYLLYKCSEIHQCRDFNRFWSNFPLLNHTDLGCLRNTKTCLNSSLMMPPNSFRDYVMELEDNFERYIVLGVLRSPANTLVLMLKDVKFDAPCSCFPLDYLIQLFVRFRIYATLKFNNRNIRLRRNKGHHLIQTGYCIAE